NPLPVLLVASFYLASDDQAKPNVVPSNLGQRGYEILESFVRRNLAKKKRRYLVVAQAKPLLCLLPSQRSGWDAIVDSERNHADVALRQPEFRLKLFLHLLGVHEDMVREAVLDPQCQTVEGAVTAIPPSRINVVRGEHDPSAQHTVPEH